MDITQKTANMSLSSNSTGGYHGRQPEIDWEEYFMGLALLSAKRSKDNRLQVGACIVNDEKRIISLGYNGMPYGRDDLFPWNDRTKTFVCHAEMNAIMNNKGVNMKGCTMYVTMHPCVECAKIIVHSGITKIVYLSDSRAHKDKYQDGKRLLTKLQTEGYITLSQYKPTCESIVINFN
ncbi:unnamed protein product [Chrysodeixis includens]|uniref:dCMP deaminase n=1 Tax=Chrysodeixis includens TaxID=689277 RepID=A0A9P0FUT6_CHRIL|nr:unnamed protein product [Chrysodeixis includens]